MTNQSWAGIQRGDPEACTRACSNPEGVEMKSILATHASILQEIPLLISKKYGIGSDQIKLGNISTLDESSMTFQLSFFDPQSNRGEAIILHFELRESAPHLLYFETLTGVKGYEKSNEYHGLETEIIKYITIKMDE